MIRHPHDARLVKRSFNPSAAAVAHPVEQRGHDAQRHPHARAHVEHRHSGPRPRCSWFAGDALNPGASLHQGVVTGFLAIGPARAEGRERGVDQIRVLFTQYGLAQTHFVGFASAEILNKDINFGSEPQD
jgi:hypothetical protein